MNEQTAAQKHPRGLYVLFFTEMWERFGFYTMGAMFAAYLRDDKQGFGWSDANAQILTSVYLALVYASPLAGGWIADRGLGHRNAVLLGGAIFMVGYLLFGFPALWMVYVALGCLILGNGFFKPNVSAMVGHQYPEGSPLKDRAFNIFYMGINIGAFFAPLVADYVSGRYGFRPAFMVAAGGMVVAVGTLWFFRHHVHGVGDLDQRPARPQPDLAAAAVTEDVPPPPVSSNPIDTISDARRIGALIVVFLIVIVFWMVFHQNSSTLVFWALDNTDWTGLDQLTGQKSSGILANSINAFFVVAFTFPLVWVWKWLNERGLEPATPTKIALGMFLTAASFFLLYAAARVGEGQPVDSTQYPSADFRVTDLVLENLNNSGSVPANLLDQIAESKDAQDKHIVKNRKFSPDEKSTGQEKLHDALARVIGPEPAAQYLPAISEHAILYKVSPWWLILAYAIVTLGELMLSPMGLSLVSKVAPVRLRGLMMGGWFGATAVGNALTMIGVLWNRWTHSAFFLLLGALALVVAVILVGILRPLKKAMPGV